MSVFRVWHRCDVCGHEEETGQYGTPAGWTCITVTAAKMRTDRMQHAIEGAPGSGGNVHAYACHRHERLTYSIVRGGPESNAVIVGPAVEP